MQIQEVERNPKAPKLSQEVIELLTRLCFRPDDPLEQVDLIFEFSSPRDTEQATQLIINLLKENISKKVFITGGIPDFHDSLKISKPESELFLEKIEKNKFPDVQFFIENKSTNTLENVAEALKVLDFRNYEKVLFVFKRHDSMRAYLTLKKFLPNTKILQQTFAGLYADTDRPLDKNTWYTYEFGITRVWGEFLRIKKYGQRGDIFYDEKIDEIVKQIDQLTMNS
jgi:uncharacterized SAM-binding protein YcdF (DUF218 family)